MYDPHPFLFGVLVFLASAREASRESLGAGQC